MYQKKWMCPLIFSPHICAEWMFYLNFTQWMCSLKFLTLTNLPQVKPHCWNITNTLSQQWGLESKPRCCSQNKLLEHVCNKKGWLVDQIPQLDTCGALKNPFQAGVELWTQTPLGQALVGFRSKLHSALKGFFQTPLVMVGVSTRIYRYNIE